VYLHLNTRIVLWKIADPVLVPYAAIIPNPNMSPIRCLLPFISTYLCEQRWILGEVNEKQSPQVPLLPEIPQVPFERFALGFAWLFLVNQIYLEMTNKLSQSSHNVQRGRAVTTVSASFNAIATQTTKRSQPKTGFYIVLLNL